MSQKAALLQGENIHCCCYVIYDSGVFFFLLTRNAAQKATRVAKTIPSQQSAQRAGARVASASFRGAKIDLRAEI